MFSNRNDIIFAQLRYNVLLCSFIFANFSETRDINKTLYYYKYQYSNNITASSQQ